MSAQVLVSRPLAPQSIPAVSLPVRTVEAPYNTGESSSSGLATAGFRTAKYLLEEWQQDGYTTFYQAFSDRDSSEKNRIEAKQLAAECEARAQRSQADSTKKLGERLLDIHFWRSELEREIRDVTAETDLLLQCKNRLQRALDATRIPFTIATDNLLCRERRVGAELVRDGVEVELIKEAELIRNIQELLKRTLEQTIQQIRMNRDAKEKLEMDWSDKVEAYDTDDKCGRYNNQSTEIQFHHNSSKLEDNTSTPETWAQYSHDNIYRAERERMTSINLRSLIDNILQDISEDLRSQCDNVNSAFANRCEEVEDAKRKMESHLKKTLEEIGDQENNIAALKQAITDKEAPIKVAQTRLYQRSYRPNVELCRDPAQFWLVSEVGELTESVEFLKQKLEEAEQCLRNLEDTRMSLEKDIANKANTLFIDREKCMAHRTRYPNVVKLSGF
ncbi:PREDICTED: tektin-4 [Nanorana parkeri]|uniref:tektin-4 n=1 Tax=Nanorana parkeri TaxID=125878 RepID=UPI000854455A|nr:PREDICTED: tektin-4 [Nanorana parkeri]